MTHPTRMTDEEVATRLIGGLSIRLVDSVRSADWSEWHKREITQALSTARRKGALEMQERAAKWHDDQAREARALHERWDNHGALVDAITHEQSAAAIRALKVE